MPPASPLPDDLEAMARHRAKEKQAAADAEWRQMHERDALEARWENIYVFFPAPGEPVDYQRWVVGIIAFAAAANEAGVADAFLRNA